MSKYFKMVDPDPPAESAGDDKAFAKGDSWTIQRESGLYILSYVSGELAGREKAIPIEEADAVRLANGEANIDEILIAYGVN